MKTDAKVLFSNDLTNILHCDSPFNRRGDFHFTPEKLESSVAETADTGIDVHLLQPAFGWFPLWKSRFLPIDKHVAWLRETYGEVPAETDVQKWVYELSRYQLEDGDIVGEFIRHCRKYGQQAFISMRMNDSHHGAFSPCEFYHQHPEYRINCESNSWADRCHNWMIPGVRDFKFKLYCDLFDNYDFDGFELDFMRYGRLYNEYETTEDERMMRHYQIVAQTDGFVNHFFGNIEADKSSGGLGIAVAHNKPGIVVRLLHRQRRNRLDKACNFRYFHKRSRRLSALKKPSSTTSERLWQEIFSSTLKYGFNIMDFSVNAQVFFEICLNAI